MYQLIGVQSVDYVSRKTNNQVTGVNLHCIVLGDGENLDGQAVERIFISSKSSAYNDVKSLKLGCTFSMYYNRYGNVESICKED